jgi:hypothetical protein
VDGRLEDGRLAAGGALLLPVWVLEYTHGRSEYRAFVSAHDGHVAGREKEIEGSGGSLDPPGPLLSTSIPFLWRILSPLLPA